jgi:hypothetical protein
MQDRPKWLASHQMRWAWLCWEPLMMLRRVGGVFETAEANAHWTEDWFKRCHSREIVEKLKDAGFNCVTTHFHKGFGIEAEREEMESAKELIALCHEYDIRVFAYLQSATFMYETFLKEMPEAKGWMQIDKFGNFSELGPQYWRYMHCFNQRGYTDFVKRVARLAILEANADGIWLDTAGGFYCYCDACQRMFREYLTQKWPAPKEVFGIPSFDGIKIPTAVNCRDVLYQEWIRFRCDSTTRSIKQVRDYAKELNPEVAVAVNTSMPSPINFYEQGGVDFNAVNRIVDCSLSENGDYPGIDDGAIVNQVRNFKAVDASGAVTISSAWNLDETNQDIMPGNDEQINLHMAECAAFGKRCVASTWALRPIEQGRKCFFEREEIYQAVKSNNRFFERNEDLYVGTKSLANVAILHSFPSMAFAFERVYASVAGFEQICFQNQIPFEIVFDENLPELGRYDVLILADQCCLSDQAVEAIRGFASTGKGLICTGDTSLYDENFRQRRDYGLADLFGVSYSEEIGDNGDVFRNGRVAFIPKTPEKVASYNRSYRTRVHLPGAHEELVDLMRQIAPDGLPLKVQAERYVGVDMSSLASGDIAVHFVNYKNSESVEGIKCSLHQRLGVFAEAELLSPEWGEAGMTIDVQRNDEGETTFRVPYFETYAVAKLSR